MNMFMKSQKINETEEALKKVHYSGVNREQFMKRPRRMCSTLALIGINVVLKICTNETVIETLVKTRKQINKSI